MFLKIFKILIVILFLNINPVYSKITNKNDFKAKNLSSYFSALVSLENQENKDSLKFFNSSKFLINFHEPYLKNYINSLVQEGKIKKAAHELRFASNEKNLAFFEAYLLLFLDAIKKKDHRKSEEYLKKLKYLKKKGSFEKVIVQSLEDFFYVFKNKKKAPIRKDLGDLGFINLVFQSCHIGEHKIEDYFKNLLNKTQLDYTRYIFFYINYLISEKKYKEAKEITDSADIINSNLLILQTKNWIDNKQFNKISSIFSCKNEADVLSEFFYLIASLYSSEEDYKKSNFYLKISNFLNPKFKFNLILLAENFYINKKYSQSRIAIKDIHETDGIYYWYKIKKNSQIILNESGVEQSSNYLKINFKKIKNPSERMFFDMANLLRNFKKYDEAINYFNIILPKLEKDSLMYAEILYRRGSSFERLGDYVKSDRDLLKSLEIEPDDAYVLNYLAYSWLERNYKIDVAMQMLEKAHEQEPEDGFIIDSIGWAHYLTGNYIKAEKFLKEAIQIMPDDPIVNDHYGDILWHLDRKMEAQYYWKSVLNFNDTDDEMKDKVYIKILKGLKKI
ncbi:MAG: hypothetical protein CMP16_03535 [Rickettsiales bacterium]|nr:hypothetical protein [Rickettsiales bacterium]